MNFPDVTNVTSPIFDASSNETNFIAFKDVLNDILRVVSSFEQMK